MSANKYDISQIRKYLNGELDTSAMYQLERQAQDDPFLMEMLQGMESSNENHQPALDEIGRLIKERVEQDRKRVIPLYRYWAAAACLLLALGIGGWWLTRETANPQLAENIKIAVPPGKFKAGQPPVIPEEKPAVATDGVSHNNNRSSASASAPEATTAYEKAVPDALKIDSSAIANNQAVTKVRLNGKDFVGGNIAQAVKKLPADIVEKIQTVDDYGDQASRTGGKTDSSKRQLIAANQPNVLREISINNQVTVTGKVVDDKNAVLPGASVSVNGGQRTQTKADGTFTITMPATDATLDVAAVGYVRQQVKVNNPANLNIKLKEDNATLDEVVVTGYGTQKRAAITASTAAIPASRTITGKITSKDNGLPIPGATVKVKGQQPAAQTNVDGTFRITVPATDAILDVTYLGYTSQEVKLNSQSNLKIELAPNNNSLAEVVVTGTLGRKSEEKAAGYATTDINDANGNLQDTTSDKEVHPVMGNKAYDQYIKDNAVMPDGAVGDVELSFNVAANGTISKIKIISGPNKAMNDKAISIIKNGPKWKGANLPKGVRLQIVFHK